MYLTRLAEEQVAVKKLLGSSDEDSKKAFLKEAKVMLSLQHENVVQFKAICLRPSAIMLEFIIFDLQCFGNETWSIAFPTFCNMLTRITAVMDARAVCLLSQMMWHVLWSTSTARILSTGTSSQQIFS